MILLLLFYCLSHFLLEIRMPIRWYIVECVEKMTVFVVNFITAMMIWTVSIYGTSGFFFY